MSDIKLANVCRSVFLSNLKHSTGGLDLLKLLENYNCTIAGSFLVSIIDPKNREWSAWRPNDVDIWVPCKSEKTVELFKDELALLKLGNVHWDTKLCESYRERVKEQATIFDMLIFKSSDVPLNIIFYDANKLTGRISETFDYDFCKIEMPILKDTIVWPLVSNNWSSVYNKVTNKPTKFSSPDRNDKWTKRGYTIKSVNHFSEKL